MEEWRADDGVLISYDIAGAPDAPTIVLQHGFGANGAMNWRATGFVDALTGAGYRVILIDARGHGQSGKPVDPALYGEPRMARDLRGLVTALGIARYDLIGYSMGAVIALLAAADDDRVGQLVIGGVGEGIVACGGVDTRAVPCEAIAAALRADDPATVTGPGLPFRQFIDATGGDRLALAAHVSVAHQGPIALDRIAMPTLLVAGDADPLAVHPDVLAAALPNASLLTVTGDHFGVFADPRFVQGVMAFLRP